MKFYLTLDSNFEAEDDGITDITDITADTADISTDTSTSL